MSTTIYFWQIIISPHMADLAVSLATRGYQVVYVAQRAMSAERASLGWVPPALTGVKLQLTETDDAARALAQQAGIESLHICQGVRANGMVSAAQAVLRKRGLRQWVIMETVDDSGWRGILKKIEYRRLFQIQNKSLQGILTNGHRTSDWVSNRGFVKSRIFPFAYFLPTAKKTIHHYSRQSGPYRLVFAGQLIPRKRVDWIINALAKYKVHPFELWIVGTGPDENQLRSLADEKLSDRVRWLGQLPLSEVPAVLAQADCLVLPSRHDGWGAVASEALMVGTPVICSDACGVAGVVRNSGCGGVFPANNFDDLACLLEKVISQGVIDDLLRREIIDWSVCLSADAGAEYLQRILMFSQEKTNSRPVEPWNKPGIIVP